VFEIQLINQGSKHNQRNTQGNQPVYTNRQDMAWLMRYLDQELQRGGTRTQCAVRKVSAVNVRCPGEGRTGTVANLSFANLYIFTTTLLS